MTRRDLVILELVSIASIVVGIITILISNKSLEINFTYGNSFTLYTMNGTILFTGLDWIRLVSVTTGIVSVYLASRENIWVWPVGIVWCLSTAWVMYSWRFFGDMALMFVYFGLQIHGWWSWKHGANDRNELPIRRASWKTLAMVGALVALAIWPASMFLSLEWVHGKAPFWDSFTTVGSLGAQFLLNRKYIENWIAWLIVDAVFVPVYFYFGLVDQAVLYTVFLVLAVVGLVQWTRLHRSAQVAPTAHSAV